MRSLVTVVLGLLVVISSIKTQSLLTSQPALVANSREDPIKLSWPNEYGQFYVSNRADEALSVAIEANYICPNYSGGNEREGPFDLGAGASRLIDFRKPPCRVGEGELYAWAGRPKPGNAANYEGEIVQHSGLGTKGSGESYDQARTAYVKHVWIRLEQARTKQIRWWGGMDALSLIGVVLLLIPPLLRRAGLIRRTL